MKRVIISLLAGTLVFAACKEKAPNINLVDIVKIDTTYLLASVPAADPHNILIENFTGGTCTNCPPAHVVLHSIDSQYAGRINIISLHVTDYSQATPVEGAAYDFRNIDATSIETSVFKPLPGMPIAGIDRMPIGDASNPLLGYKSVWPSVVSGRLTANDSLNLDIISVYDSATRKAAITVTVTYLQPVSLKQNLSIAVVEDSFIDKQEYFTGSGTGIYDHYGFNDVFRGMVTSVPFGDPFLADLAIKEAKRVYKVTYYYDVKTTLNPHNCRLIAFVNGNADVSGATVYQSKQTRLAL